MPPLRYLALLGALALWALVPGSLAEDGGEPSCGCKTSRSSIDAPPSGGGGGDTCSLPPPAATLGQQRRLAEAAEAAPPPPPPPRVVRLPLGSATLGTSSPHFAEDAEGPPYAWRLAQPLWVDAFEVSNDRFGAFSSATGYVSEAEAFGWSFVHEDALDAATAAGVTQSAQGAEWWVPVPNASWRLPRGPGQASGLSPALLHHPAVHMSKRDGDAFCAWAGGRLPTEEEWEYAARGGSSASGALAASAFPWGNSFYAKAAPHRANIWQGTFPSNNTAKDGYVWTAPVDAFGPQNALGLYSVIGNAWEWTSTRWCPRQSAKAAAARAAAGIARDTPAFCRRRTPSALAKEREDAGEVDYVKKGGSFMCHKSFCYRYRVAARHHNTANSGAQNLGLRCVYDALPAWAEEHVPAI